MSKQPLTDDALDQLFREARSYKLLEQPARG